MHSADVDGVELPSPLLAEAQSFDCVISAVYFSTAQGTAPITLYLSHLYNRGQWTGFKTEEPRHTPRIVRVLVCPIIHCS